MPFFKLIRKPLYKYWLNNLKELYTNVLVIFTILQHKVHSFKPEVGYCCTFKDR